MRICSKCGAEMPGDFIICGKCGNSLNNKPQPTGIYSQNYDIFLSYRRDGGETMAILLRDRLTAKGYRVFLDIESLNAGSFNTQLLSVIEGCNDVVVICSKGALDRCANADDWVRAEIAHAFRNNKNVVPIMLRGFEWPDVLPGEIDKLRMQNGVVADRNEYFDAAIDRLADKFLLSRPKAGGETAAEKLSAPVSGQGTAITSAFTDPIFLLKVREKIGKPSGDIYASDVPGITRLSVGDANISSLAGIEYFIALMRLDCAENNLGKGGKKGLFDFSNIAKNSLIGWQSSWGSGKGDNFTFHPQNP